MAWCVYVWSTLYACIHKYIRVRRVYVDACKLFEYIDIIDWPHILINQIVKVNYFLC